MAKSLYEEYGTPLTTPRPGPGTYETKQIETVDNDQMSALAATLEAGDRSSHRGTRQTEAIETVDDDVTSFLHHSLARVDPPGTSLTATIETSDEDAASVLSALG